MAKKKNSRKALAVALGILGVAGLSMASASNLNITASPDNLATGVATFGNSCDDAVAVAYTTGGTSIAPTYTAMDISGIAAACVGKTISYSLAYSTWNGTAYVTAAPVTASDVAITAANSGTNKLSVSFATPLAGTSRLDNIAITIK